MDRCQRGAEEEKAAPGLIDNATLPLPNVNADSRVPRTNWSEACSPGSRGEGARDPGRRDGVHDAQKEPDSARKGEAHRARDSAATREGKPVALTTNPYDQATTDAR